MDRDEILFQEYKMYAEQKEKFTDRNFTTNKFYMISVLVLIIAMIYTSSVVFMHTIPAVMLFSLIGILVCFLWWTNVDAYNTLIKIKFTKVLEKMEEFLPAKPFQDESEGIREFKKKKVFMFSDIQKILAAVIALFFFAIFVSEFIPFVVGLVGKVLAIFGHTGGI